LSNLDKFYEKLLTVIDEEQSLSAESKSVALFRAAIETGASEMGVEKVVYVMSKLMTTTMGIVSMEDGDEISYKDLLKDWDKSDVTEH
jgi:hypothetical protein|tara:strand:- start:231 stop:494 length:264 start_codon:yes stop_codon:yes gene_type:complete